MTAINRTGVCVVSAFLSAAVIASCLEDSSKPLSESTDAGPDATGMAGSSSGGTTSNDSAAESAGRGGVAGNAVHCPPKATSCPKGCNDVSGHPIDFANECLGDFQPIGCYLGTGGELTMIGCVRDPETTISYKIPSISAEDPLFGTGEWEPCPGGWMTISGGCL